MLNQLGVAYPRDEPQAHSLCTLLAFQSAVAFQQLLLRSMSKTAHSVADNMRTQCAQKKNECPSNVYNGWSPFSKRGYYAKKRRRGEQKILKGII